VSPDVLAIALGLFSALTLATTNLVVKATNDVLMTRTALSLSAALIVAPVAFFLPLPTPELWAALAISVPIHLFYQVSLIRAMHRGDLSLVFPVMRGLAPLLVAIGAFIVLKEELSLLSLSGLIISVCAVMSFAFLRGKKGDLGQSLSREALFWAAMTAIGVMCYTVADARGVRLAENRFTFVVWLFILDCIGVTLITISVRQARFWSGFKPVMKSGFFAAVLGVASYGAALIGYSIAEAARITALRETAVIFGAVMGWLILKEGMGPRRIVASVILAVGLMIMELGA
jgi:drug/metabolite transporter (DMT)-like permease